LCEIISIHSIWITTQTDTGFTDYLWNDWKYTLKEFLHIIARRLSRNLTGHRVLLLIADESGVVSISGVKDCNEIQIRVEIIAKAAKNNGARQQTNKPISAAICLSSPLMGGGFR
jgi:hypothetical protein